MASSVLVASGTVTAASANAGAASGDSGTPSYCVPESESGFRCFFDSTAGPSADVDILAEGETEAGILQKSDCPDRYLCLWDDANYVTSKGFRRYVQAGAHDLAEDDFRNQANSVFNNRQTQSYLIDLNCVFPDGTYGGFILRPGQSIDQLSNKTDHPCGGSWNNTIDVVQLHT